MIFFHTSVFGLRLVLPPTAFRTTSTIECSDQAVPMVKPNSESFRAQSEGIHLKLEKNILSEALLHFSGKANPHARVSTQDSHLSQKRFEKEDKRKTTRATVS